MYYCIPIIVNDRKYVTFSLKDRDDINHYSFLASLCNEGRTELLRIKKKLRATCSECRSKDLVIKPSIESNAKDGVLNLSFSSGKSITPKEECGFIIEEQTNDYAIYYNSDYCYKKLDVNLVLKTKDAKEFRANIQLHMIPDQDYFKAALDFGSESSQFKIMGRHDKGTFVDIISEAKKKYCEGKYENNNNSDFHQYDNAPDNQHHHLFKTLFYVDEDKETPLFLTLKENDETLSKAYPLLSNIKISLLHANYSRIIYEKIIRQIINTVYSIPRIADTNTTKNHFGVQLSLLVPNVMDFNIVNSLIKDLQRMLRLNIPENFHIEITPISESDASFAGYVQTQDSMKGVYLTIDGGKGTFDYSLSMIFKNNGIQQIGGILSGGFVGAGGAITYALFEHVCAVIVGFNNVDERRALMRKILQDADPKGKLELYNALEKIKKSYSSNDYSTEQNNTRCNELKTRITESDYLSLTAGGLANILENDIKGCLGDQYSILLKTCYDICSKLINSIEEKVGKNPEIDEIIFAGRALRFPILDEVMRTLINEKWGETKIVYPMSAKGICLNGAINTVSGNIRVNHNCGLLNLPQVYSIEGRIRQSSKKIDYNSFFTTNENFFIEGKNIEKDDEVRVNGERLEFRPRNGVKQLYYTGSGFLLRDNNSFDCGSFMETEQTNNEELRIKSIFPFYTTEEIDNLPIYKI